MEYHFVIFSTDYHNHRFFISHPSSIKFSRTRLWLLWLTAIAVGLASMFTIVTFFGTQQSVAVRALYAGLHRLGWSFATAWIVFACALGYAGPLRTFLSSRALVPLSRLTYCAYLTNGLVELYQAASLRTPKYMSTINMVSVHWVFGLSVHSR